MSAEPNIDGFRDAQRRLREKFGRTVTFFTPGAKQYDPSLPPTVFDPETGEPFDPTIEPTASGYASAAIVASRVFKPLTATRGESSADALGQQSRLNQQVIVDIDDQAAVRDAEFYELDGERWSIDDVVTDGIGAEQRVIVYSKRDGRQ